MGGQNGSGLREAYSRAIEAYRSGDLVETKALIDAVVADSPSSPEGLALRFLRGNAYEWGGYPGGVNLEKAYTEYRGLEQWAKTLGSTVLVSAARVLFDIDGKIHRYEIEKLCLEAIAIDGHAHAKMLLGLLSEKVLGEPVQARRWYFAAYLSGLPWGLRYYADSHKRAGNLARSAFWHLVTTITSPILVLVGGPRGAFKDGI